MIKKLNQDEKVKVSNDEFYNTRGFSFLRKPFFII